MVDRDPAWTSRQFAGGFEHLDISPEELGIPAGHRPRRADVRCHDAHRDGFQNTRDVRRNRASLSRFGTVSFAARTPYRAGHASALQELTAVMELLIDSSGLFLDGLIQTFKLALLTLLFATLVSLIVGVMSVTAIRAFRIFAMVYVELFRDVPLLVSLFFVYFGAPLIGLPLDPFAAAVVTLSLWGGANGAEIVRGGFNSIPKHQRASATALGLKPWEIYWFVLVPQALLPIIPPFTGLFTLLVQSTSLAALIGVPEFFRIAQIIVERTTMSEGYSPAFLVFGVVLLTYYVICSALNFGTRKLENHMRQRTSRTSASIGAEVKTRRAEESV